MSEDSFQPWTATPDERPFSKREARRFLAVDSSGRESFIVPLSDPRLIEEAREQIRNPDSIQRNIIFALPVLSQGAENRNLKNPYRTPWSWEIKEVYGFESFGSDSCNGTPSIVEDFLHFWTASERLICFRDYRIVTELE